LLLLSLYSAAPDYDEEIRAAVAGTAHVYAVPVTLVRAVITHESAFRPSAFSPAGAIGLMQVMPFNASKLGLDSAKQLWNPRLNILAGVRLLAVLLKHYQGDVVASLVAYNSGPKPAGARVPDNGETPGYVLSIVRTWQRFESEAAR
jgi:soluble lytic murein transglycosylase-like protein